MSNPKLALMIALVLVTNAASGQSADQPQAQPATSDKTAVLTGESAPARDMSFNLGMDLLLGQMTGIRPSIALLTRENSSLQVEGYYGALFTKFGASEGAGAGVRWVTSRGGLDAVTIGPGVDVLFNLNRDKAMMLAPTVDLAWRHSFGNRAALVLGINAGIGVGMSGRSNGDDDGNTISGKVTPLISFYSGLRY